MTNNRPQVRVLPVNLPSPQMHVVERAIFMLVTAICATGFLHATFFAYANSLRGSAAVGWFMAMLVTMILWRLYRVSRKLYVDNMVAMHVMKAVGVENVVATTPEEAKKLLDKHNRRQ